MWRPVQKTLNHTLQAQPRPKFAERVSLRTQVPPPALPDSLQFCVILTIFTAIIIILSTLPWCWHSASSLIPLKFCENTPDAGLEEEGQVWFLLSEYGCLLEGEHSCNLTCCSVAFCWSMCPAINCPDKPAPFSPCSCW